MKVKVQLALPQKIGNKNSQWWQNSKIAYLQRSNFAPKTTPSLLFLADYF